MYERRIVTVLFADLVGFTALSERLDAEDVATIQDSYFATVREAIGRHGGVLEKFIGDAAMAAFGVPRARDDDPQRAVRAGLAIASGVERLNGPLGLAPDELAVRVGIATGEVAYAVGGSDQGRLTGDTVNTAARLQTAAPPGRVLVGDATALAVADAVDLEAMSELTVKGKAEPIRVALVRSMRPVRSREAAMSGLRAPMLGRESELALLHDAAGRVAQTGRNEFWLVVAPPGTGKTRLLDELDERLGARGTTGSIWRAQFHPGDGRPFGAVADLAVAAIGTAEAPEIESRIAAAGVSAGRAGVVAASLLELAGGRAAEGTAAADREARFEAWLAGLDGLRAAGPASWLIEDLHWAGPDELAFLQAAHDATPSDGAGRLVVATARPALLETLPAWAAANHDGGIHHLRLAGLESATAGDLVRALVGDALPAELTSRIATVSDGNCLFIEELLRSWISVGLLARRVDGWDLTAPAPSVVIPTTVQAVYAGQLDDLPGAARGVARQGSVGGRRAARPWLLDLDVPDSEAGLQSLTRRQLLAGPDPDALFGESYIYRHALLHEAAYASLARADRAALHVRYARWAEGALAEHPDELAELLAEHFDAALAAAPALARTVAGDLDRDAAARLAAIWLERAAEGALRAGAREHATDLFSRTIARTDPGDVFDLARREWRLGEALSEGGDMDEAIARLRSSIDGFRRALAAAPEGSESWADARSGLASAGTSLARTLQEQIQFEAAWTVAEQLAAEIGAADDLPSTSLRLRAGIARSLFSDSPSDVRPAAEVAIRIAARDGDPQLDLDARTALLAIGSVPPTVTQRQAADLARAARRLGRHDVVARALRVGAMSLADLGLDPEPLLDEAAELTTNHGLREALGWVEYSRGEIAFATGRWDRALESAMRAIELGIRHAHHRIVVRSWYVVTPIAHARGDLAMLRRAHEWHEAMRAFFPDSPFGRLMHRGVDLRLFAAGLSEPRQPDVEWLLPSFKQGPEMATWLEAADGVIRHWLRAGLTDAAGHAVARMDQFPGERTALGRGAVGVMRGRWQLAVGDPGGAAATAREAIAALLRVRAEWWIAKGLRLLDRTGSATPEETSEAEAIERHLGAVAPTP